MRLLGSSIVIVLALVGAGFLVMMFHGSQLESEAPQYLSEAIPAIAAKWDPNELLKRGSPELLKVASEDQVRELFEKFSPLGAFVRYDGATGGAGWNYANGVTTVTGSYVATATFENGQAVFTVELVKRNDQWTISSFQIKGTWKRKKEPQGT